MQRIKIFETETTRNNIAALTTRGSVFIPGFASNDATAVGVPVECRTLKEFMTAFGEPAPKFKGNNFYPYVGDDDSKSGFPKRAIPKETDGALFDQVVMYKDGDPDPSWEMAYMYLSLGLPVAYLRMNKVIDPNSSDYDVTVVQAYKYMDTFFSTLTETSDILDKGAYNIQFVTTGGYPTLEYVTRDDAGTEKTSLSQLILNFVTPDKNEISNFSGRGDCIALLDHTNNPYRDLIGDDSIFKNTGINTSKFAAIFTPWCELTLSNLKYAPASFIYLYNVASRLQTGNTWNIYAGIGNGRCNIIKQLNTKRPLTNKIAEYYQNDFNSATDPSINAITYIRNYGYCIWGNRTYEKYKTDDTGFALSFVNIRNLVSEVKKRAYFTSQQLMFEVNNDVLWAKFRANMSTLLDTMTNGNGLEDYMFIRNMTGDKTKLSVAIVLYPTYGVESVEINIRLEDNNTETVVTES